jgi:hypothetical protein
MHEPMGCPPTDAADAVVADDADDVAVAVESRIVSSSRNPVLTRTLPAVHARVPGSGC